MPAFAAAVVSFLRELRRRRVYRTVIAYAAAAFIVLQGAELVSGPLGLPGWTMRLLIVLAVLGFPVAAGLAWAFDVTPGGVTRTQALLPESAAAASSAAATPRSHARGVAPAPGPSGVGGEAEPDARPGIVVLPFENLSPDPGDAYFSDGLSEEIITMLSQLRGLRVISRSTAMVLKGTSKDVRTIGRELGVGYLLEGSVRKAGDALRVTAQLIDARTDAHLWAERHDGAWADVFEVQEKIARRIVSALEPRLAATAGRLPAPPIADPIAYAAYLQARQLMWEATPQALRTARTLMQSGLGLVGPNPLFLAGLSYVYMQLVNCGFEGEEYIGKAEACARRALEIDPRSSEAHVPLGLMYMYYFGQPAQAFHHFRAALDANPDNPDALLYLAGAETIIGRMDDADALVQRALRVDPLTPLTRSMRPFVETWRGQIGHTVDELTLWYTLDPRSPAALATGAFALSMEGHRALAREFLTEHLDPTAADSFTGLAKLLLEALQHEGSGRRITAPAELEPLYRRDSQCSYMLAETCAVAGDGPGALHWLTHALTRGFSNHVIMTVDRMFDGIRSTAEFERVLASAREQWQRFEA